MTKNPVIQNSISWLAEYANKKNIKNYKKILWQCGEKINPGKNLTPQFQKLKGTLLIQNPRFFRAINANYDFV